MLISSNADVLGGLLEEFKPCFSKPQFRNFSTYMFGLIACEGKGFFRCFSVWGLFRSARRNRTRESTTKPRSVLLIATSKPNFCLCFFFYIFSDWAQFWEERKRLLMIIDFASLFVIVLTRIRLHGFYLQIVLFGFVSQSTLEVLRLMLCLSWFYYPHYRQVPHITTTHIYLITPFGYYGVC